MSGPCGDWMPKPAPRRAAILWRQAVAKIRVIVATTPGQAIATTVRGSKRFGPRSAHPERAVADASAARCAEPPATRARPVPLATHLPRLPCSRRQRLPRPPRCPHLRQRPTKPAGPPTNLACVERFSTRLWPPAGRCGVEFLRHSLCAPVGLAPPTQRAARCRVGNGEAAHTPTCRVCRIPCRRER